MEGAVGARGWSGCAAEGSGAADAEMGVELGTSNADGRVGTGAVSPGNFGTAVCITVRAILGILEAFVEVMVVDAAFAGADVSTWDGCKAAVPVWSAKV